LVKLVPIGGNLVNKLVTRFNFKRYFGQQNMGLQRKNHTVGFLLG
jgi:hypothetical protein